MLGSLYYGFLVRPYSKNVAKSLRKEAKWYCSDWSTVTDPGQRAETFVACQLLKAVELWSDIGLGSYELYYLRNKQKREVDFLVVRGKKPWFMVEVELSDTNRSPRLEYYQKQVSAPHAFQAVVNMDYIHSDCFKREDPCVVPAKTLSSQLC
ncbi:MAG: DUF4143 domain-containing protein [Planctomycetota bacterium]